MTAGANNDEQRDMSRVVRAWSDSRGRRDSAVKEGCDERESTLRKGDEFSNTVMPGDGVFRQPTGKAE